MRSAVGVYVSAGGFSRGMEDGGLDIIAHLGDGGFGLDTLLSNFPDVDYFTPFEDWPLERMYVHGVDVMYCAPPCAPWSAGGGQGKKLDTDPRVAKMNHAITAGITVRPKIWIMESVVRFPKISAELVHTLEQTWMEMGYSITHFYTNYLLHDTPTNRNRYHFIAHRVELDEFEIEIPDKLPVVRDYLPGRKPKKDEVFVPSEYRRQRQIVLDHVPPGHRVRKVFRDLAGLKPGEPGGPSFNLYRLRMDYPASTLISSPRQIHPNGERILTVEEAKALAGYPPDFIVEGKTQEKRYRELGKGVLPKVAEFLGEEFGHALGDDVMVTRPRIRTIDWRPQARALLRQKPAAHPFPKSKHGSMPELKTWFKGNGKRSLLEKDESDEDE